MLHFLTSVWFQRDDLSNETWCPLTNHCSFAVTSQEHIAFGCTILCEPRTTCTTGYIAPGLLIGPLQLHVQQKGHRVSVDCQKQVQ